MVKEGLGWVRSVMLCWGEFRPSAAGQVTFGYGKDF